MPHEDHAYLARRVIAEERCARDAAAAVVHRRLAKASRMRLRALAHDAMKRFVDHQREGPIDRGPGGGQSGADRA